MLIYNYGLFWKHDSVAWGKQKVNGHLKGRWARNRKAPPVDFREQQGVYVLYDDNFKILYVGQAGAKVNQRLFDRLRQYHTGPLAQRWTRFSWFGTRKVIKGEKGYVLGSETSAAHPSILDLLNHIEAILIASTEPPHNRQAGRFGPKVRQYVQVKSNGPSVQEMVKELWESHKKDSKSS